MLHKINSFKEFLIQCVYDAFIIPFVVLPLQQYKLSPIKKKKRKHYSHQVRFTHCNFLLHKIATKPFAMHWEKQAFQNVWNNLGKLIKTALQERSVSELVECNYCNFNVISLTTQLPERELLITRLWYPARGRRIMCVLKYPSHFYFSVVIAQSNQFLFTGFF